MRDRLFARLAQLSSEHPRMLLSLALVLAVASATFAAKELRMNADTDDLIAPDRPYMQRYQEFIDSWGDLEAIYLVIAAKDESTPTARREEAADWLGEEIRSLDGIPAVNWKIRASELRGLATHSAELSEDDLQGLLAARPALELLLAEAGPSAILREARVSLNRLIAAGGFLGETRQRSLGAKSFFLTDALLAAGREAEPDEHGEVKAAGAEVIEQETSISDSADFDLDLADEYLVSGPGRFHLIRIQPAKDFGTLAVIAEPLALIRERLDAARARFPDLEFGLTGKPVLQADEMATSDRDMTRASIIAILLVGSLFALIVGGVIRPLLAVLTLLVGIAWTFGLTTLVIGQLNLLSVIFTLILVGIGIDFGVHLVTRFQEERRRGLNLTSALSEAICRAGPGNLTGAVTSSLAFFMAMATGFQGLVELGFIAGTGLLFCLLAMMTVLPALISIVPRAGSLRRGQESPDAAREDPPARLHKTSDRVVLIATAASLIVSGFVATKLRFNDDVLALQSKDLASVHWEHRLLEEESVESWFGVVMTDSREELEELERHAARETSIGRLRSVSEIAAIESEERRRVRVAIGEIRAGDSPPESSWGSTHVRELAAAFRRLLRLVKEREPKEAAEVSRRIRGLENLAARIQIRESDRGQGLAPKALREGLSRQAQWLRELIAGARATTLREALPELPRQLLTSADGRFLLMMHPNENVWELEAMKDYVAAMRRVAPGATGAPMTHLESIRDMKSGFSRAALFAFLAVLALLAFDFRRPLPTFLALIPLLVGGAWLLTAMHLFGLSFNLANFFSVPILIGIGVDNGVHLVHRWKESGALHLGSTRRAVLMTSLTTAIGFGCLATASHLGLRSLGLIMALGSLAILLASLIVLPALLRILESRKQETQR